MLAYYVVTALHVLVCLFLILVVLLQSGKGADLASAFGGASTQTAFGSRGPASFLSKVTTGAAVVFMITCLSLSLLGNRPEAKSILETGKSAPAASKPSTPASKPQGTVVVPTQEQIRRMQEEAEAKARAKQAESPAPGQPATPAPVPEAGKSPAKK
ncbi:MAG: preprotein translocase subunit SecG [Acidobacteria bacterium]|nr:preprotein translocase subunit SecG [Acidobacteriota bacterium]